MGNRFFYCLLLALIWGSVLPASTAKVVFLQLRNWKEEVVQLEPRFRCAHLGILINHRVYHAYPQFGSGYVTLKEFLKLGEWIAYFNLDDLNESDALKTIKSYLGKPYDSDLNWSDEKMYCSELVAKALGIQPSPMHFDPKLWPESYLKLEGKPGISPSKVYEFLSRKYQRLGLDCGT